MNCYINRLGIKCVYFEERYSMVKKSIWIIRCDSCGKEYDIPQDISTKIEDMEGQEQMVLEVSPECPYCKTMNSRLAVLKS